MIPVHFFLGGGGEHILAHFARIMTNPRLITTSPKNLARGGKGGGGGGRGLARPVHSIVARGPEMS